MQHALGNRNERCAESILIVDDDVHVLRFVAGMLSSLGYSAVFQASSMEEALELFKANANRISLVISDFVMPCCTGDQLLLHICRFKPSVRTVLISGNDPSSINSAIPLQPGINFLQKPFTLNDMRRMVESLSLSA